KSHCYKIINWEMRIYYDTAVKIANALGKEPSLIFQWQQKNFGNNVANNETKV
ncbi:transcriptional regulator, partial [Bacillus thuringiensis]